MEFIEMHCESCDEKWEWHDYERDVRIMFCPVCDKNPDSGLTNEEHKSSYNRAVERFKTTILKLL